MSNYLAKKRKKRKKSPIKNRNLFFKYFLYHKFYKTNKKCQILIKQIL